MAIFNSKLLVYQRVFVFWNLATQLFYTLEFNETHKKVAS